MRKVEGFLFFLILVNILGGCSLENASAPPQQQLVIASDYLKEADTLLFQNFKKQHSISVHILSLDYRQIKQRLSELEANSGIDLIMMKSVHHAHKFSRQKLLQNLDFIPSLPTEVSTTSSEKYDYVSFGIDPFLIAHSNSFPNSIKTYDDLTRFSFIKAINYGDEVVMLSPALQKMKRVKANKWIQDYSKHGIAISAASDSLSKRLPVLISLSAFTENKQPKVDLANYQYHQLSSPSTGSFYNIRTISLAHQPEHYSNARKFIEFYSKKNNNIQLNKAFYTLSIFTPNRTFRKYSTPTETLASYFSMVERVLEKIAAEH